MKLKIIMVLFFAIISSVASAENYHFSFIYKGIHWDHTTNGKSKEIALEIASQDCLNHFTNSKGQEKIKVDAETADALLNTCANPKQSKI